jgi:acyl-CoA hydrolase
MEVGIRVEAEDIRTKKKRHTNSCYFTMVAVDETGRPVEVAPLTLQGPADEKRFDAAKRRREIRKSIANVRDAARNPVED